jgi:hypothetical protein
MCKCKNVKMGSYSNQTILVYPDWFESKHFIRAARIDNCLVEEIKNLWNKGIQTTANCCGHNITPAVISVIPEHIEKMKLKLGEHLRRLKGSLIFSYQMG